MAADMIVLGPGSFYGSVLAAVAAPGLQREVAAAPAPRVLVHNLFSVESVGERVACLVAHGVPIDVVVVQSGTRIDVAADVEVVADEIARPDGLAHDPALLSPVLRSLSAG